MSWRERENKNNVVKMFKEFIELYPGGHPELLKEVKTNEGKL